MADPCPVCGSTQTDSVFSMPDVPVHVAVVYRTAEEARAVERGDLDLRLCTACSYVWNAAYDPGRLDYGAGYDASLHHSPRYKAFLEQTAHRLSETYALAGTTVMEVGCGEGSFLRLLCQTAGCNSLGIDPSAPDGDERVGHHLIHFIPEPFGDRHTEHKAALVASRQMFHYLEDPVGFAARMGRAGEVLYVEIPNAAWVFADGSPWTVFYEHVAYFSPAALARTLQEAGLAVDALAPCYDSGQYLFADARPGPSDGPRTVADPDFLAAVQTFGDRSRTAVEFWNGWLEESIGRGETVVVWGAAGRGTTFLNAVDPDGSIRAVVDNNPARQGTFVAGTGHPIIAPEALAEIQPDVIVLTNATYADEIRAQVQGLGVEARFVDAEKG